MLSPLGYKNCFEFLAFFVPVLVVSYLQIQQTINTFNYRTVAKPAEKWGGGKIFYF